MADSRIGGLSRQSDSDLKITFEHKGETITVYLPTGRGATNAKAAMGDYVACALCCSQKSGFAACMARCLYDGQCCDGGLSNCDQT